MFCCIPQLVDPPSPTQCFIPVTLSRLSLTVTMSDKLAIWGKHMTKVTLGLQNQWWMANAADGIVPR